MCAVLFPTTVVSLTDQMLIASLLWDRCSYHSLGWASYHWYQRGCIGQVETGADCTETKNTSGLRASNAVGGSTCTLAPSAACSATSVYFWWASCRHVDLKVLTFIHASPRPHVFLLTLFFVSGRASLKSVTSLPIRLAPSCTNNLRRCLVQAKRSSSCLHSS